VIEATNRAACSATGSRSGSPENSKDSACEVMSASVSAHIMACRVFSASGPKTRVAGQDYHCDGELARAVLHTVQAQGDMFRQYQGFAALVPVPDDARAFDRALSLSGRDPGWPNNDAPA
jgi:hypothetical protein